MHCDDVNPEITGQWDIFECMMCNQTCLFSARVITLYQSKQKKQSKIDFIFHSRNQTFFYFHSVHLFINLSDFLHFFFEKSVELKILDKNSMIISVNDKTDAIDARA